MPTNVPSERIERVLYFFNLDIASKTAHICGPPAMMDATKKMLAELGMPNTHIKTEAFGAATHTSRAALRPGTAAVVSISAGLDCVLVKPCGSVLTLASASGTLRETIGTLM